MKISGEIRVFGFFMEKGVKCVGYMYIFILKWIGVLGDCGVCMMLFLFVMQRKGIGELFVIKDFKLYKRFFIEDVLDFVLQLFKLK